MSKKIILCSDGTGQKGGDGPDTNVFRIYKMVDNDSSDQLVFYDDGIGTDSNVTAIQALSSTFGFGFGRNVINLYKQLVRHYVPGDKVFLFGYSRGAATVRALAGMIQAVGLMRRDCEEFASGRTGIINEIRFHIMAMKAMYYYKGAMQDPPRAEEFKKRYTHGVIDIEFIGVWDTVESLGFPKESSWLVIGFSMLLDKIMERFFPKRHYNYQLDKNVKQVYHALAVDENRFSFQPLLWDETAEQRPEFIKQVWFSGNHGNIGGGLTRTELSSISLNWIMKKAKQLGIRFYDSKISDVREEMNYAGKLYNSRRGIKNYYRFGPRHIRDLSQKDGKSIINGDIKIHNSVFRRMGLMEYYPVLPNKFEVVYDEWDSDFVFREEDDRIKKLKSKVNLLFKIKTISYHVLVETSVMCAVMIWYLNRYGDGAYSNSVIFNTIMDFTPSLTHNFLYYVTHENGWLGVIFTLIFTSLYVVNKVNKILIDRTLKQINWGLLQSLIK